MAEIILDMSNTGVVKQVIAKLSENMKEGALEAINEIADEIVDNAKNIVRVDTGSLQRSIRKERAGNSVKIRAGGYVTNPKTGRIVDYASIIEIRYPYMRPAYEMVSSKIVALIEESVLQKVNQ